MEIEQPLFAGEVLEAAKYATPLVLGRHTAVPLRVDRVRRVPPSNRFLDLEQSHAYRGQEPHLCR